MGAETGEKKGRPALFLDRDGVINVDTDYTWRVEDLVLTPTAAAAIARANRAGWLVVVVTNQSGVARGYYTEEDVHAFHAAMADRLAAAGARIDAFYHCPYHPEGSIARYRVDHPDRKPRPGMLLRAIADHGIDAAASLLLGDRSTDLEAAAAAGVRGVLVEQNVCDLDAVVAAFIRDHATG